MVSFNISDETYIEEDKVRFIPSIPNGVGVMLNETQAKENVYLILTGVGPVRHHEQVRRFLVLLLFLVATGKAQIRTSSFVVAFFAF